MALIVADRIKATTNTTGTGTYTIGVASTGFENFSVIGDGNTTYYCCTDETDFEVGIGTYTASGTTLARTTILQSSNSDNAVNWGAGAKTIFCTQPAEKAVFKNASGNVTVTGLTSTFDASLGAETPTADRTINLPDASGTLPVFTTAPTAAITDGTDGQVLSTDGSGGLSFISPTEVLISSGTVSNVASIDFDSSVITGFEQYRVVLYNVKPASDTRELRMRLGTSNTAITSSIYQFSLFQYGLSRTGSQRSATVNNANSTFFYLTAPANDMGTNTGENCYAEVLLPNPNSTSGYKHVVARVSNYSYYPAIMGQRISAMAMRQQSAINFITFFAESGNIATASFRLYGIF